VNLNIFQILILCHLPNSEKVPSAILLCSSHCSSPSGVLLLTAYFAHRSGCEVLWSARLCVCLWVCLSAHPHARSLPNCRSSSSVVEIRCFRFCGWHHVF